MELLSRSSRLADRSRISIPSFPNSLITSEAQRIDMAAAAGCHRRGGSINQIHRYERWLRSVREILTPPSKQLVRVYAVCQRDGGNGCARFAGLIDQLTFELNREPSPCHCSGQVLSDTTIGFFAATFRSYTDGDRLPKTECSRSLL